MYIDIKNDKIYNLIKPHLPPAVSMYNHSAPFPSPPPSPFPPTAFFMVPNNLLTPPLLLFPLLHGWVNFVTCKIYLLLKYVRNESYIYGHIWLYIGSQKEILYWENSCGFPAQANKFQTLFIGKKIPCIEILLFHLSIWPPYTCSPFFLKRMPLSYKQETRN